VTEGSLGKTDALQLAADEALRALDLIPDPVVAIGEQNEIFLANRAFRELFAVSDPQGAGLESVFDDSDTRKAIHTVLDGVRSAGTIETEIDVRPASGGPRTFAVRGEADDAGGVFRTFLHFRDLTEKKRMLRRLELLEYRDRPTGLPNRRSLDLVLEKEIARVERSNRDELLAVLFISLENIARINQTYGHEIGDILLENSGLRIKESIIVELLRGSDYIFATDADTDLTPEAQLEPVDEEHMVFRFDGREFTAVLTGVNHVTDAAVVANRIARRVSMPYRDKFGSEIYVNCNIGIAVYPTDGVDRETVIQHAASAMHEAKRLDEEFLLFNQALHARALEMMRLGGSIYTAFIESQFDMYFQPVVDYTGEIVGAEALIRWHHPERGLVPPSQFIPLAEEKGIIVNIGKWALYQVCEQLARWPEDIYVSINTSPQEMTRSDLLENISRVLAKHGDIDPRRLKVEITERDAMQNPDDTIRRMQLLSDRGIEILIDDFGVGNSSLSYLKRLPASTLKIDRSFVTDAPTDPSDAAIVRAIIAVGHSLGLKVVGEGVETEAQRLFLQNEACDECQGFLYQHPLPPANLWELLTAG